MQRHLLTLHHRIRLVNLENAVEMQHTAQHLDSSSYMKKILGVKHGLRKAFKTKNSHRLVGGKPLRFISLNLSTFRTIMLFFFTGLMVLFSIFNPSFALPDDDQAQIEITSDKSEYNHQSGIATYTGNVIVIQGSRQVSADILHIYRNINGDIDKIVAIGTPARFHFQPELEQPILYARANTITYVDPENLLELDDDAEVTQGGDVYAAPLILYNLETETINSPNNATGRTTVIIQPRED